MFEHACKMGLEGIVSKRRNSAYRSGRSSDWIKSKNPAAPAVRREAEEELGPVTKARAPAFGPGLPRSSPGGWWGTGASDSIADISPGKLKSECKRCRHLSPLFTAQV